MDVVAPATEAAPLNRPRSDAAAAAAAPGRAWPFWAAQAVLLPLLAVVGYRELFSQFMMYDDQGYMMITVRHLLDGHRMYDAVVTPYGPFYYLTRWVVHGLLHVPLTHDVVRLNTLVYWVGAVAAAGYLAFALTRDLPIALLGQGLLFVNLRGLAREPGHPQDLLLLVVALMPLVGLLVGRARPGLVAAALGAMCGAVLLTKINLGVFAVAACGAAMVASMRGGGRWAAAARVAVAGAALALPVALMHRQSGDPQWATYQRLEFLSIASLLLVSFPGARRYLPWRDLPFFAAGAAAAVTLVVAFALAHGTTLGGMINSVVVMPTRQVDVLAWPPPLPDNTDLLAIVSVIVASAVALTRRRGEATAGGTDPRWGLVVLKLAAGFLGLVFTAGLNTNDCLGYLTPVAWLVAVPTGAPDPRPGRAFARLLLAWLAVTESMWAFPVAGTQVGFSAFLPAAALFVCLADALHALAARGPTPWARRGLRLVATAPLIYVGAVAVIGFARATSESYARAVPLDLPGTRLQRAPAPTVRQIRVIVANLAASSDTFLATNGFNSLYFWTGKRPATDVPIGNAISYFSREEQRRMLDAMSGHPRACVLMQTPMRNLESYHWLFDRIDEQYDEWFRGPDWRLMIRKGRPRPKLIIPPPTATPHPPAP